MFREVLRKVCVRELGHVIAGEAADGRSAVEVVLRTRPDLVLLDLHLPNLDGFGVVEAIRRVAPRIRILVLSSHCDAYSVFRAERARVQGFVDKNTSAVSSLKKAIAAVSAGGVYFSETFLRLKAKRLGNPRSFDKVLGAREQAVLALVGEPMSDPEIARVLHISEGTVAKHRANLRLKLRLPTTTELMRYARDHGFTLSAPRGCDEPLPP